MVKMKKTTVINILSMCFMAVSVFLMALPLGVAMRFVSDPGPPMEYVTYHYSYFGGMPLGYGNWFPIMTAFSSTAILIMLVVNVVRKTPRGNELKTPVVICLVVCIVASLLSWLFFGGPYAVTTTGIVIFLLHVATYAMQLKRKRTVAREEQPAL
jgi:hypothetical protein